MREQFTQRLPFCGAQQKFRLSKQAHFLLTAATSSARLLCYQQRSHRSPSRFFGDFLVGARKSPCGATGTIINNHTLHKKAIAHSKQLKNLTAEAVRSICWHYLSSQGNKGSAAGGGGKRGRSVGSGLQKASLLCQAQLSQGTATGNR